MKFGQYELLERMAIGAMAEIYRGRVVGAEGFEKPVAIKRIHPDLAQDDRFVRMLLTEAKIHAALSHRNIVQIHDLGISDSGEYFIVLEFVDGQNLRALLDVLAAHRLRMDDAVAVYIAHEVAQGLQAAHELRGPDGQPLGLVHRDVSPSNILISYAGEVKLSDFGLAKRRHDRSLVGSVKGNFAYMAPEQARREDLDRRTDVFSLGAVLFELLTGQRLRVIENEVAGWAEVASGELIDPREIRPDLSPELEEILSRALAPRRENRYQDAAALGAALREVAVRMRTAGAAELSWLLRQYYPEGARHRIAEQTRVIRLDVGNAPPPVPAHANRERSRRTPPSMPWPMSQRRLGPVALSLGADGGTTPPPPMGSAAGAVMEAGPSRTPAAGIAPSTPAARVAPAAPPELRLVAAPASSGLRHHLLWLFLSLITVAATVVHFAVVPLDVLAVWNRPAWLYLATEPEGANVILDGRRLDHVTPVRVQVRRDRAEHVVEFHIAGRVPTRAALRYDRAAHLSILAAVEKP